MYSYSLSFHMTTFALFLSYENPTICSFHRILITEQSASQTQALSCADRYPVAKTVRNLWRILAETQPLRGRRCILLTKVSENSSQELSVPPCPQEIKSSHSNNIIVITALQRDK